MPERKKMCLGINTMNLEILILVIHVLILDAVFIIKLSTNPMELHFT